MHRWMAGLIVALAIARLQGQGELAEVVSEGERGEREKEKESSQLPASALFGTHSIMLALVVDLMQMV